MHRVVVVQDGSTLAASADGQGIYLLHGLSGALVRTLRGHTKTIDALAFSPNGRLFATGGKDQVVRLWDVRTGKTKHVLRGHQDGVRDVAFSPDGTILASVSDDQTLRLWNVVDGAARRPFRGHTTKVMKVAFSADNKRLISGDAAGLVIARDTATGKEVWRTTGTKHQVTALAVHPHASFCVVGTAEGMVRLYAVANGKLIGEYPYAHSIVALLFTHRGEVLTVATTEQIFFLTVPTWESRGFLATHETLLDAAVTASGRLIGAFSSGLFTTVLTPSALEALSVQELQTLPARVAVLAEKATQAIERLQRSAEAAHERGAWFEKRWHERGEKGEEGAVLAEMQHTFATCAKVTGEALGQMTAFTAQLQQFSTRVEQTSWAQRKPLKAEFSQLEKSLRGALAHAQAPCWGMADVDLKAADDHMVFHQLRSHSSRRLQPSLQVDRYHWGFDSQSPASMSSASRLPQESRNDIPLQRTAEDLPHHGLFIRRNNFFGTQLTGGLRDLINQGVLIDQDTIRFDDFVAAWTHGIPTPQPGRALAVSYGIAPIPPHQRRHPEATHYLEIALRTAAEAPLGHPQIQPPTINYVFVVDKSGSMDSEAKMGSVKRSIASLLEKLRPDDHIGVVAFDDTVQTVFPSTRKSTLKMAQASTALSALKASGGTDIRLGLTFGLAELEGLPEDSIRQILLFSDGNPTSGVTDWLEIRRQIAEKTRSGPVISVFAYGSDANREELDKLAGMTGGHSTDIVEPLEALSALRKQLQRRDKIAALNLQVQLHIAPDIRVLHFFGHDLVMDPVQRAAIEREVAGAKDTVRTKFGSAPAPDIFQEAQGIRVVVPNLAIGETYWLAFELAVPNGREAEAYGKALVQYFDTFVRQNARSEVQLTPRGHIPAAYVPFHALALAASEQVYYALTDLYQNDLQTARARIERFIKVLEGVDVSLATVTLQPTALAEVKDQVRRDRSTLRKFVALAENLGKPLVRGEQLKGPSGYLTWGLNTYGQTRGGLLLNVNYSY